MKCELERSHRLSKVFRPKIEADRLALGVVSATPEFRPVYDFLSSLRFYSVAPEEVRKLQEPDPGLVLKRDGSNAASVLRELKAGPPDLYERICSLLSKIAPGTSRVDYITIGRATISWTIEHDERSVLARREGLLDRIEFIANKGRTWNQHVWFSLLRTTQNDYETVARALEASQE